MSKPVWRPKKWWICSLLISSWFQVMTFSKLMSDLRNNNTEVAEKLKRNDKVDLKMVIDWLNQLVLLCVVHRLMYYYCRYLGKRQDTEDTPCPLVSSGRRVCLQFLFLLSRCSCCMCYVVCSNHERGEGCTCRSAVYDTALPHGGWCRSDQTSAWCISFYASVS